MLKTNPLSRFHAAPNFCILIPEINRIRIFALKKNTYRVINFIDNNLFKKTGLKIGIPNTNSFGRITENIDLLLRT